MSETLQIEAALGSAINPGLYEDCIQALVRSAWRNSNEETRLKTEAARLDYFGEGPESETMAVVGRFNGEAVGASLGRITDWSYLGMNGEYVGLLGKRALDIRLFGVREPYRNLGFGSQILGATAHLAHLNDCKVMSMNWADFQWDWLQTKGGFEGKYGLIAESVRALPVTYAGFDPAYLTVLSTATAKSG